VKGAGGSDTVVNNTNKPDALFGEQGDDSLQGGSGKSYLHGGADNDKLWGGGGEDWLWGDFGNDMLDGGGGNDMLDGGGGNDYLYGGLGNDILKGQDGADYLFGGADCDALYGGKGDDYLYGDTGNDVLVSIGGGKDQLGGGSGLDNIWMDVLDTLGDASNDEKSAGYIHKVDEFFRYSFDGGKSSIPVSKELDGQNLADPVSDDYLGNFNFKSNPLFASGGPTQDDVFQGDVGDCYFMARLLAMAKVNPESIRKMVVDLGDGTYAVRFFHKGAAEYVRVDADFYTQGSDAKKLAYAGLGQENSIWVAIVEKAFAFWRKEDGHYASIGGGITKWKDTDEALGLIGQDLTKGEPVAPQKVVDWFKSGSPDIGTTVKTAAVDWLKAVKSELAAGKAVIVGAVSGVSNFTPLVPDDPNTKDTEGTYRRGQHVYLVDSVQCDANGQPIGITLRNPYYLSPVTLTDLTRIYFCLNHGRSLTVV
jgi:hypothetical protein